MLIVALQGSPHSLSPPSALFEEADLSKLTSPVIASFNPPDAGDRPNDGGRPGHYEVVDDQGNQGPDNAIANSKDKGPIQVESGDRDAVDSDVARSVLKPKWVGSASREKMPEYDIKLSKEDPDQQRAIMWMTGRGKQHFDQHFGSILAQWGVAPTHKGTCISLPADWAALDPIALMEIFKYSKCPLADTERAVSSQNSLYLDIANDGPSITSTKTMLLA